MRISFGGNFQTTLKKYAGQDSPEAIREKQKALMTLIENKAGDLENLVEGQNAWENTSEGSAWLQIYERLLNALSGNQKQNPIQSLDTLERLEKLLRASSIKEGESA